MNGNSLILSDAAHDAHYCGLHCRECDDDLEEADAAEGDGLCELCRLLREPPDSEGPPPAHLPFSFIP